MLTIDEVKVLRKHLEGFPSKLNGNITLQDEWDMIDTLEAALKVVEAAKKVVRAGYRQSRENAPLEYALWESLEPFRREGE